MTSTDADKLITAARQATAERDRAREEAARLLTPDPVDVVSDLLVQLWTTREDRDALSADLTAIRGMVCRPEVPIVEAVRRYCDDERKIKKDLSQQRDDAFRWLGCIAVALGLSKYAPSVAVLDAAKAMRAAADVRAALDRVAKAAGVDSDSTGAIVADRVIKELREAGRAGLAVAQCRTIKDAADILFRDAVSPGAPSADRRSDLGSALLAIAAGRANKTEASPAALPADLRTYLETRRDRLQGGHGLGLAAEIAALNRWLALPTAEVAK